MTKRILAGLAAAALGGTVLATSALAHPGHNHYNHDCGHANNAPEEASETKYRHSDPAQGANGGYLIVYGSGGYLEASGKPGAPPEGGIDGKGQQAGVGSVYGAFNSQEVCAGTSATGTVRVKR